MTGATGATGGTGPTGATGATGADNFPPDEWTVEPSGSLVIEPSVADDVGNGNTQPFTAKVFGFPDTEIVTIGSGLSVDGSTVPASSLPAGLDISGAGLPGLAVWAGSCGAPLCVIDGAPAAPGDAFFVVDTNGQTYIGAKGNTNTILAIYDITHSVVLATFEVGGFVTIYDGAGNPAFQVQDDGSVHIQTGKSIVADL